MAEIAFLPSVKHIILKDGKAMDEIVEKTIDRSYPKETYRIQVKEDGIYLRAGSENGLLWAQSTLSQLKLSHYLSGEFDIPCLDIIDYPDFELREWVTELLWDGKNDSSEDAFLKLFQTILLSGYLKFNRITVEWGPYGKIPSLENIIDKIKDFGASLGCEVRFEDNRKTGKHTDIHNMAIEAEKLWNKCAKISETEKHIKILEPVLNTVLNRGN